MSAPHTQKTPAELIEELRLYQSELEAQNEALRFSRMAAEGASERFESLFSKVPLALMEVDELGMIVQSNAMALGLFRPFEHDAPLNFLIPLVQADHAHRVEQALAHARQTGHSELTEVVFLKGSQGVLTGDLHIARIEYSDDELQHFICAVIDQGPLLAERQALQTSAKTLQQRNEALLQSENRLAAIINSSLDAILCVDAEQRITVFNPAAASLFQCPLEAALHTPLARFLPEAMPAIATTKVGSRALLGEVQGHTATGQPLSLEVSVSCERHAEGSITTVFARDLTDRKAMEAQLRESHKMQAVGTMAGGIAHDFNNILGAILGNVDLAKQDLDASAPALVSLLEIEKAGRRARDLVRQILTFSRKEAPQRLPLALEEVLQDTLRLIRVTQPPHVEFQVNVHASTPVVLADPTQVEQALLNLCTNAIHAIGAQRGLVTINLELRELDSTAADALGLSPGRYATMAVRDTGSGMSPQTVQRIFEPFYTTKQVGQGTGLGLAVVHGVMRAHLGAVEVQSTPDQGSQFTLYFPAFSGVAPVPEAPAPPVSTQSPVSGHVMYVDDDQALVFLVKRALSRKGLQVSTFDDPHAALDALRTNAQAFDLLVTDFNMPGFSGVDLMREVSALCPHLPMALASGYVTPEIELSARQAGARALIYKPNDVEELCATVVRLLQEADDVASHA